MPVVDLETPTPCLVGAPNVGKSSLVRLLSTGKPGVYLDGLQLSIHNQRNSDGSHQLELPEFSGSLYLEVTDTPGLLRRHDQDRNNLEKLTLAVLSHLLTAVLYVHDLSGECGTSPSDQWKRRVHELLVSQSAKINNLKTIKKLRGRETMPRT